MSYWNGNFKFEYDSYDENDYVECTDGKDTYIVDFVVKCTAYAEGREDLGSWNNPYYSDIDEVTLEDMDFSYCVAYKKTGNIDDVFDDAFDTIGDEDYGYVIIDKSKGITLKNCSDEARRIWDTTHIYDIVERKMEDYAYDISGEADYDYF